MTLQIRDHSNKISFAVEANTRQEATAKAMRKLEISTNLTVHKPCSNGNYRKI